MRDGHRREYDARNLHSECVIGCEQVGIRANPLGAAGNHLGNDASCGEHQTEWVTSGH